MAVVHHRTGLSPQWRRCGLGRQHIAEIRPQTVQRGSCVPVQFGGGLKIKCVEAMAHGKALITTPIGAEGLEDAANTALLIETTEEGWTRAIAEVLEAPDKRQALCAGALNYARAHFTEAAAFGELFEALRGAGK